MSDDARQRSAEAQAMRVALLREFDSLRRLARKIAPLAKERNQLFRIPERSACR